MTLVGKIFTVLTLLLSVLFMAFSMMTFATHTNWRDKYIELNRLKENQSAELKTVKADLDSVRVVLAQEQASRRQAIAALQTRLTQASSELASKERDLQSLSAAHAKVTDAEKIAQERLKTLEGEVDKVRTEVRDIQGDRDVQFEKVVALTEQLNQAEGTKLRMEERNASLLAQVAQQKMVMDAHGLKADSLVAHIPPKVEGVVLAVGDKDLIEISLGSDDGLKEGHSMEVYRGDKYLGRVIIRKTSPDRAVGQMVKELQRGSIKKGDNVSTKLG